MKNLITFKTAVLAKELGFTGKCLYFYTEENILKENYLEVENGFEGRLDITIRNLLENSNKYKNTYSAPTQSELQDWIVEKYNVHITVDTRLKSKVDVEFITKIYNIKKYCITKLPERFSTRREALEQGLYNALEIIRDYEKDKRDNTKTV